MNLEESKKLLKKRISLGIAHGLKSMEEIIVDTSLLLDEFINVKSQYNDLKNMMNQNLLTYEQMEIGLNKIRVSLQSLIARISPADLEAEAQAPKLRNTEMQYRKNNFFKLLEIHFQNLNAISITLTDTIGDHTNVDQREGRYAFDFIYRDIFTYAYQNPHSRELELVKDIRAFSEDFFFRKYRRFEVYMKTLKLILNYIMEEEMEQDFYLNILESVLSNNEMKIVFYYAMSDQNKELKNILIETKLLDKSLAGALLEESHWDYWKTN